MNSLPVLNAYAEEVLFWLQTVAIFVILSTALLILARLHSYIQPHFGRRDYWVVARNYLRKQEQQSKEDK